MEKVTVTRSYETEVFRAKDGKEFDSEKMCELYEKQQEAKRVVFVARPTKNEYAGMTLFYHTKDNRLQSESDWFNAFLFGNGGRNQYTFANALFDDLKDNIRYAADELDNGSYNTISDLINDYFSKLVFDTYSWTYKPTANKKGFSNSAKRQIKNILESFWETEDYNEAVAGMMTVLTGEKWETVGLHGCCQGDYMEFAYNTERMTQDSLDAFESELFNLGAEYMVYELYEGEDFPTNEDELEGGYTTYIHDPYEPGKEIEEVIGSSSEFIYVIPA